MDVERFYGRDADHLHNNASEEEEGEWSDLGSTTGVYEGKRSLDPVVSNDVMMGADEAVPLHQGVILLVIPRQGGVEDSGTGTVPEGTNLSANSDDENLFSDSDK